MEGNKEPSQQTAYQENLSPNVWRRLEKIDGHMRAVPLVVILCFVLLSHYAGNDIDKRTYNFAACASAVVYSAFLFADLTKHDFGVRGFFLAYMALVSVTLCCLLALKAGLFPGAADGNEEWITFLGKGFIGLLISLGLGVFVSGRLGLCIRVLAKKCNIQSEAGFLALTVASATGFVAFLTSAMAALLWVLEAIQPPVT